MAYDYAGSWDTNSGHQANLYPSESNPNATPFNTEQAVSYYISQGVPSSKLILGMPLYGRAFTQTSGPGTAFNGVGPGSWENGIWDYKVLPATASYDSEAGASYSYDAATRTMVSYDTVEAAGKKVEYMKSKNLGGAMWWEASGDRTVDDQGSLIGKVTGDLGTGGLDGMQNVLNYPDSVYDNLRAEMGSEMVGREGTKL